MTTPLGRRSTVVGSWLVFTAVATGVGLAAVELVSDPILEQSLAGGRPQGGVAVQAPADPGAAARTLPSSTSSTASRTVPTATSARPSPSTPSTTTRRSAAPTRSTSSRPPRPTASRTSSTPPRRTASTVVTASRTVRTEAGSATARCSGATGRLSSWSPAPGWRVKNVDPGPDDTPKVEFESEQGEVRVDFRCSGGRPVSAVQRSS